MKNEAVMLSGGIKVTLTDRNGKKIRKYCIYVHCTLYSLLKTNNICCKPREFQC